MSINGVDDGEQAQTEAEGSRLRALANLAIDEPTSASTVGCRTAAGPLSELLAAMVREAVEYERQEMVTDGTQEEPAAADPKL